MAEPAALPAADRASSQVRDRVMVVASWAVITVTLLVVQFYARRGARARGDQELGTWLFAGWSQFDGPEYLSIAAHGYEARQLVWFPLYPLTIRTVSAVLGDPLLSAVLISTLCGGIAVTLLWRWLELRVPDRNARFAALAVALLYPYGWFLFGVVYSDALFLALVLGAFVLVERDRYLLAGLVGAFATATRPSGFALVAGLVVIAAQRSGALTTPRRASPGWLSDMGLPLIPRWRPAAWRPVLAVSLSVGGLTAYCLYQLAVWGAPFEFVAQQRNYHAPGYQSLLKDQFFRSFTSDLSATHLASISAQAVLLSVVILSIPAVGRRFGWGYAVFVLGLAAMPAVSVSTFMGVGRYLLPAFPCFALLGEWLVRRRWTLRVWVILSGLLLVAMAAGFSRSFYLT